MKLTSISPRFVKSAPNPLEPGVLYVSEKYATALHLCCCGCGQEVVTPLSPAEWQLRRRGSAVSLYPSIGNWSFPCKSHYWIKQNEVIWAELMSDAQIARVRERDQRDKGRQIRRRNDLKLDGNRLQRAWKTIRAWFRR